MGKDFQQHDMSGQLFKNERASKDTHPQYTGSMTIKGVRWSIAAWVKDGKKGKYLSLSIKPYEDNAIRTPRQPRDAGEDFQDDESLPF